ncbi:MAG: phage terminase large subunit family protein [Rhizobiaceae bacterium]|nr:phage terminase large subunit family protein [Rhizobiaceae bacterium]
MEGMLQWGWKHALRDTIGLDASIVDSSDGKTMERVYAFCFPRLRLKIMAGKGVAGNRHGWKPQRHGQRRGGRLHMVAVEGIKSHLIARLSRGHTIRFSKDLPLVWFEQLASECLVVRYSRGQQTRLFERIPGREAEALDCVVYGFAARQLVHANWLRRRDHLCQVEGRSDAGKSNRVIRSSWMV